MSSKFEPESQFVLGKLSNDRLKPSYASSFDTKLPESGSLGNSSKSAKNMPLKTKYQAGMNGGRWTEQEHQSFLAGLRLYGREWKKVASTIKTRTSAQIRSHAQKYFAKLARDDKAEPGIAHLSVPSAQSPEIHVGPARSVSHSVNEYNSDSGMSSNESIASSHEAEHSDNSIVSNSTHYDDPERSAPRTIPNLIVNDIVLKSITAPSDSFRYRKRRSRSPTRPSALIQKRYKLLHNHQNQRQSISLYFPSHEELLEKVSPDIRHRVSSLVDAEICALQVLSLCDLFRLDTMAGSYDCAGRQEPKDMFRDTPIVNLSMDYSSASRHAPIY